MTNSTGTKFETGPMAAAADQIRCLLAAMPIVIFASAILEARKRPTPESTRMVGKLNRTLRGGTPQETAIAEL